MEIVHLTPHFLPQIDGLGDYSRLMGKELRESFGWPSRWVVGDPEWRRSSDGAPADVTAVAERSGGALLAELGGAETVILHYVCYGYHKRGTPFWINEALRRWRQRGPGRLIIVFHELWASGPPWRSEFYLRFFQRRLVTELHRLCDAALTSGPVMFRMLEAIAPGKTTLQTIPSGLPTIALAQRALHRGGPVRVIAFGQEASRLHSVRAHEALLRALHREGLLAGVKVVGKGARDGEDPSAEVALLRTFLPADLVTAARDVAPEQGAALLAESDLFLSYYPSFVIGKSSALMAALGCGCVPVLPETRHAEPLADGRELLACDGSGAQVLRIIEQIRRPGLAALAEAGWIWYDRSASWPVAARRVAALLQESAPAAAADE